jgi:HipA-like protein
LNNRLVGHLLKEAGGAVYFRYDESWLSWDNAIPLSLSLPLREKMPTAANEWSPSAKTCCRTPKSSGGG